MVYLCRATPAGEAVAANLEALLAAWEAKDTVCIETGRDLITPKLRELTRRTAALAKEGHLQGGHCSCGGKGGGL